VARLHGTLFKRVLSASDIKEIMNQDKELKEELDKIDWKKYLDYGNIKVQVRNGKETLIAIERTYPD